MKISGSVTLQSTQIHKLSDQKLLQLCAQYGEQALKWKRKFAGLLPEVNRRKLYEKKGCVSIFEFAAKFSGMSKDQVALVLNLEQKFEDKPILKIALINGEISVNKLARVASVATNINEEFWVNQSKLLSNRALETLVKDEKISQKQELNIGTKILQTQSAEIQNGLFPTENELKSLHVQTLGGLKLTTEVHVKLLELQEKGIDINKIILQALENRDQKIAQKKEQISQEQQNNGPAKRYIPVKVKNIIKEEFGEKCAITTCKKPALQYHHTKRYGLDPSHDPKFMAHFCKEHHQIAHTIDVKFQECRLRT